MKKILSKGHTRGSRWIALPVLALAVLLSIVVAWCMEPPAENAELMYVFVDNDDQVHIIDREHQIAYETESLQFHTDTSAADLQILLRKKENVTITKDGETFTAAAFFHHTFNTIRQFLHKFPCTCQFQRLHDLFICGFRFHISHIFCNCS